MGATSVEDLHERLAVALADADDWQFREVLERAMFAAEIMGYAHAGGNRNSGEVQAAAVHEVHLNAPITIQMPEQPAPIVNVQAAAAPQP